MGFMVLPPRSVVGLIGRFDLNGSSAKVLPTNSRIA